MARLALLWAAVIPTVGGHATGQTPLAKGQPRAIPRRLEGYSARRLADEDDWTDGPAGFCDGDEAELGEGEDMEEINPYSSSLFIAGGSSRMTRPSRARMTRAITLAASSAGSADASWRPAIVMGEERGKLETRYSPRTKLHAAAVALALIFSRGFSLPPLPI